MKWAGKCILDGEADAVALKWRWRVESARRLCNSHHDSCWQPDPSNPTAITRMKLNESVSRPDGAPAYDSHPLPVPQQPTRADFSSSFCERSLSAFGAAVVSAILVNPLDVVKTRLQAQAAGFPKASSHHLDFGRHAVTLSQNRYKGTLDVFYKVIRQEGFWRLWRGTNASLALAIPTVGIYLPCYDVFRNWIEDAATENAPGLTPFAPLVAGSIARSIACIACSPIELAKTRMQAYKELSKRRPPGIQKTLAGILSLTRSSESVNFVHGYRFLWTGVGAQLARDVPFSAICWSTLEPMRRRMLGFIGDEVGAASLLGANFMSGFVAGTLAAAITCPLDVAKTRRQIEKDPSRILNMTTWRTLTEIWRGQGVKGLFTGVGPRAGRAGPSVGIVVSFYELVKYMLHHRDLNLSP